MTLRKFIKRKRPLQNGFTLAVVVITGLIITVGAMSLVARSLNHLVNSTRQQQRREAREIAETGVALIMKELNDNFPYLLIESCNVANNSRSEQMENPQCAGWKDSANSDGDVTGTFQERDNVCPNSVTPSNLIMQELYKEAPSKKGKYRLIEYSFIGDRYQGGWATIKVQGQRLIANSNKMRVAASAVIEQEMTIAPKYCELPPFEELTPNQSSGYGLVTENIALGVGDIIDENPNSSSSGADVHCTNCDVPPLDQCDSWTKNGTVIQNIPAYKKGDCKKGVDISEEMAGVIDGKRTNGEIDIPDAPTWDTGKWGNPTPFTIGYDAFRPNLGYYAPTINHASTEGPHPNIPGCYTEITNSKKITHCRIKNISSSIPLNLEITPEDGDIRFYVEGNQINLAGIYFITPDDSNFGQFTIFGGASTWESAYEKFKSSGPGFKSLNWAGSGEINAFLYMPYFNVNFSGGTCESPQILRGAAITYSWNATGDCSQIRVPTDAGNIMREEYGIQPEGTESGSEIREFAAIGVNRWNSIQLEN